MSKIIAKAHPWHWVLLVAVIVAVAGTIGWSQWSTVHPKGISVTSPKPWAVVTSPIRVAGSAHGSWYFEANLPVVVVNWDGLIIGEGHATAKSDWMKDEPVYFEGSVDFTVPTCAAGQDYCRRGAIIFKNDNPSGDPARSKSFELPVLFK